MATTALVAVLGSLHYGLSPFLSIKDVQFWLMFKRSVLIVDSDSTKRHLLKIRVSSIKYCTIPLAYLPVL